MGLFDFFKTKTSNTQQRIEEPINPDMYLISELQRRIEELGYSAEKSTQYISLIVESEIELATEIINSPENHPSLIQLHIVAVHKVYFPNGIHENIVGVGTTLQEKVTSVIDNYLSTTFPPIIDSFRDSHQLDLDFTDDNNILWHPKLGNLSIQGQWENIAGDEPIFDILKDRLKSVMPNQKINWLKVYVSRLPNDEIIVECLLNNQHCSEGYEDMVEYVKTWKQSGVFLGQKQFIMFRRCDACD
jgi:Family of unknown function (DUF6348)